MGDQVTSSKAPTLPFESGMAKSEMQFRRLLEALPAAAYTCDRNGLITYFNRHAAELWGREPKLLEPEDRFCGSFRLFDHQGEPIPHDECWMALALRHDREFNGKEVVIERPDGERRTVLANANPIRNEAGAAIGAVNLLADITVHKRAEEALARVRDELEQRVRERTEELEALNRELESFNYSVSHDLRAPLRGIDGFSRVLEEDYSAVLDDRALEYLGRIRAGAERMGRLIDALLGFSGIVRSELSCSAVDLTALATITVEALRSRHPERRVDFELGDDLIVAGDERLLSIALDNLLENAWKFTGECERPLIELGRADIEGEPCYFVRDNGTGFDMRFADRIFTPFQRLHEDTRFEGTGIGLATVQRIVHRHGGRVWAESTPGKGATFYFTLSA